jgi:hypothetical protein
MATIAEVLAVLEGAVVGNTQATTATEGASRDVSIAAGGTIARLAAHSIGASGGDVFPGNSNETHDLAGFTVTIAHKLGTVTGAPTEEEAYLALARLDQQKLTSPGFWRSLAGVYEVASAPELEEPERVGNVLEYSVTIQIALEANPSA